MKRGFAFRLFMIWAAWGLLALPANAERMFNTPFADLPGMVKRDRWQPNPGVPPQPVDWQKLLALKDLYWVIGNQSVLQIAPREHDSAIYANPLGVSRGSHPNILTSAPVQPGFELVTFFPLAVSDSTFRQITAMPGVISFQNADGKNLEVVNEVDKRVWRPDVQTDYFRVGDAVLRQEVTTSDDIFVLRIKAVSGKLPPKFSLRGNFGETKGALDVEQSGASTFVWGQEQEHSKTCFALWSAAPLQAPEVSAPGQILGYTLEGTSGDEITLAFGFGYRMADLEERMKAAAADPAGIFAEATRAWDEFFTRMVPFFDCDDQDYVRQYYFIFYCVYANFLDVPYQPLAFPYGVTSKLLWKDQNQPWNSGNDTLIMSWLSDKSLAEGNVLGPLRRGNWTISTGFPDLSNPVIKDVNEFRFFQNLSLYSFWWETYLKTRNKAWLEKVYPALVRHHDKMCQGLLGMAPLNARGLAPWGLDDWDASSRWMKWQADTRVDTSTYLVSSLECLQKMAEELGETEAAESHGKRAEEFRKKIRELLWDEKTNLFLDANLERGTFSPIHSSGSFIPLFARIPTPEQAAKLVENLVDPGKFWTPYPIPGLSLDMPDFKPDGANIGNGPIMAYTSGWFTTSGLVDYGYTGLAAEIVRRQIKMATVEGVSSPSKHNPITGEGLSWVPAVKQNNMLTTIHSAIADLIIRYVVGFRLRQDDLIEFDPIAAEKTWDRMKWGPFLYGERTVSLDYRKDHGMTIECDGAKYHAPSLQHVLLKLEDGKLIPVVPEPVPEIEVSFPDMASSGRPMGRPSARPSDAVARHWRFDGDADESTGSPLQGTVQGAVFGSGRLGQAAEFDGNRARVDMGATDLHLGNNFTIAFWFKAGEADGADQVILAKGEGEEGGFKVYRNPHGEIFFQAQGMGRSPTHYPVPEGKWPSGLVVNDGEWHHFAMVREPLEVSFYLDGQKVSTHVAGGVMKNHTAPFSVGAAVDGGQPYNGSLDELFILGWSLNPDEVKKLMENQYAL